MDRKMRYNASIKHCSAVSEIVGGLLLLIIAVLSFSAIYSFVFPLPVSTAEPHVKLIGYVSQEGVAIIEHVGGETLTAFQIDVRDSNGSLLDSQIFEQTSWSIGEKMIPTSMLLPTENDSIQVKVYTFDREGNKLSVFEGTLKGSVIKSDASSNNSIVQQTPWLISSLLTNTTDEDLICFNKTRLGVTINESFAATTFIYNWLLNDDPITALNLPFDLSSADIIKDYSTNLYHGSNDGAVWNQNGKVGGGYYFDGNSSIQIPFCFSDTSIDEITVEAWIKTTQETGSIISFNDSNYFELSLFNGKLKWSTSTTNQNQQCYGQTNTLNDGAWHLITATYDRSTGNLKVFVDGIIDSPATGTSIGESIGTGSELFGYIGKSSSPAQNEQITIFNDNFETDKGWSVENDDNLLDGTWERGTPVNDERGDPPQDSDGSGQCYVTENEREKDIDGGKTWLISPTLELSEYQSVQCSFDIWYRNDYGNSPDQDYFYVDVSDDDGNSWTTIETIGPDTPSPYQWYTHTVILDDYISLSDTVKLRFEASDEGYGSVVEAGVDAVNISGVPLIQNENFTGYIDEVKIYNRALSEEQIYQNYLNNYQGNSSLSVIVSEETITGETWSCEVTPNNQTTDAKTITSQILLIKNY